MGNRDYNPNKSSQIGVSIPFSTVIVIEYTRNSGWPSSGWYTMPAGQHFQLLLMTSLWLRMPYLEYLHIGDVKTLKKQL